MKDKALKNVKGTWDVDPVAQKTRLRILDVIRGKTELYGYQSMETPVLSYFSTLASKYAGGAEILKEVYRLGDRGGRELGLRYDLTVPFARYMGMNPGLAMPFRRYEVGKVFRDGPVKTGRNREFYQCDIDVVGIRSIAAEAELLSLAGDVFDELGLDIYIEYNSRNVLLGIINAAGVDPGSAVPVVLILDKLKKKGEDSVRAELGGISIGDEVITNLFRLLTETEREGLNSSFRTQESIFADGLAEIRELDRILKQLRIKCPVQFNPCLARGLEIYTGLVWEIFSCEKEINSSIGAGGRYDSIISSFIGDGREYPAVGMTFGIDVIYEVCRISGTGGTKPAVELLIIPMDTVAQCMEMAGDMRKKGIRTEVDLTGRRLKKSLGYADKKNITYVLVVGTDEIDSGTMVLRDMSSGKTYDLDIKGAAAVISDIIEGC